MAESQLSICNQAILLIGGVQITSIDENSREAKTCKALFDTCVRATLSAHKWNFATRRRTLADTGNTVAPWAYGYAYPSDCLTARYIVHPYSETEEIDYEVAIDDDGRKVIYTDKSEAVLVYTQRLIDYSLCHTLFIEALVFKLASRLAAAIPGKSSKVQENNSLYMHTLHQAMLADANEGVTETDELASWTADRLGVETPYTAGE